MLMECKTRKLSESERRLSSYAKHSTTVVLVSESSKNEGVGPEALLLSPQVKTSGVGRTDLVEQITKEKIALTLS